MTTRLSYVGSWTTKGELVATFKRELERRGADTIGEEATNDVLVGLTNICLVNEKLTSMLQLSSEIGDVRKLQAWSIAYYLAASKLTLHRLVTSTVSPPIANALNKRLPGFNKIK